MVITVSLSSYLNNSPGNTDTRVFYLETVRLIDMCIEIFNAYATCRSGDQANRLE
jgi:hypothetical protein